MRRTKIVATLGPASYDAGVIDSLINTGADVLRLNFAHADARTQTKLAKLVREGASRNGRVVSLLADLPGPKMRTGPVRDGEVRLESGQSFELREGHDVGGEIGVTTTVPRIASLLVAGDEVFLADGQIVLEVKEVQDEGVRTRVIRGGILRSGKGMHIPGAERKLHAFGARDEEALRQALEIGADLIGLSFVRDADDVAHAKERVAVTKPSPPAIVAKIETRSAVDNLDEIIQLADAVMIARGDLGIQLPFREIPLLQKNIIAACNQLGKPVITATQMLESMTRSPLPTRAEVNDVANAVIDGTDAVMLSEETAVGDYPVETVRVMSEIAMEVELRGSAAPARARPGPDDPVSWAIARAAVQASEELKVALIVCPTRTGATARRIAAFRPSMPILAIYHSIETLQRLALVWGVVPFQVPFLRADELSVRGLKRALTAVHDSGLGRPGERMALVAGGSPPRVASTDLVRILTI
ncbi:MAG: pyruvate kinase [Actinomycetota bacterium]|nr:pyruvate kinase [Actinomycetota bacterium]